MRRDHALHEGLLLPGWLRRWVYAIGLACLLTGAAVLGARWFLMVEGEFGPLPHPLEHWSLIAHGVVASVAAWVFGMVWLAHVRRGLHKRRNLLSGLTAVGLLLALGLTGWGLYYLGDQDWRARTSVVHWVIGIAVTVWLPLHAWWGRRSAPV